MYIATLTKNKNNTQENRGNYVKLQNHIVRQYVSKFSVLF